MKVKTINVTVKYTVELGDIEIPENIYNELDSGSHEGLEFDPTIPRKIDAAQWLADNIREGDCMDWTAEVFDIQKSE